MANPKVRKQKQGPLVWGIQQQHGRRNTSLAPYFAAKAAMVQQVSSDYADTVRRTGRAARLVGDNPLSAVRRGSVSKNGTNPPEMPALVSCGIVNFG